MDAASGSKANSTYATAKTRRNGLEERTNHHCPATNTMARPNSHFGPIASVLTYQAASSTVSFENTIQETRPMEPVTDASHATSRHETRAPTTSPVTIKSRRRLKMPSATTPAAK